MRDRELQRLAALICDELEDRGMLPARGAECQRCRESREFVDEEVDRLVDASMNPQPRPPDTKKTERVYFIQSVNGGPIKIGKTIDVAGRLRDLQTGSGEVLRVLYATAPGAVSERDTHTMFASCRLHGEWFSPDPTLLEYIEGLGG